MSDQISPSKYSAHKNLLGSNVAQASVGGAVPPHAQVVQALDRLATCRMQAETLLRVVRGEDVSPEVAGNTPPTATPCLAELLISCPNIIHREVDEISGLIAELEKSLFHTS